jgi:hypothetical protein
MSRWTQNELDRIDAAQELTLASATGDRIDAAYQTKYGRRHPTIMPSIITPQAREATLKLLPRETTTTDI